MNMKSLILGTFALATLAYPGIISIGVKGGVPLNDAFNAATSGNASYFTNTKRYTIGPELDVNLPLGLAIEFDALYGGWITTSPGTAWTSSCARQPRPTPGTSRCC